MALPKNYSIWLAVDYDGIEKAFWYKPKRCEKHGEWWDDSLCGFKCSDVTGNINFCFTAIAHCSEWSIVGNKFDKKSSV